VVLDNLGTHTPEALYETFAPAEARRIPSAEALAAYERRRNAAAAEPIRWESTNENARDKLHRLYPPNPS
jgi:hypothetical protein